MLAGFHDGVVVHLLQRDRAASDASHSSTSGAATFEITPVASRRIISLCDAHRGCHVQSQAKTPDRKKRRNMRTAAAWRCTHSCNRLDLTLRTRLARLYVSDTTPRSKPVSASHHHSLDRSVRLTGCEIRPYSYTTSRCTLP